jgi:hypothetical protein
VIIIFEKNQSYLKEEWIKISDSKRREGKRREWFLQVLMNSEDKLYIKYLMFKSLYLI